MFISLPEQTVTDVRENVQKHMDTDERKHAHRENDQRKLGKMRYRMHRFVGDRGHEFVRGARMAFRAGLNLVRAHNRRGRVLGALDIMCAMAIRARWRAGVADFQFSTVEAFLITLYNQGAEPVLLRHYFLFMTGPAGLDHVKVIYRRFPARFWLYIVRRSMTACTDRAVG